MNISQICSNAHAIVARRGWAQGSDVSGVCIVEALYDAADGNSLYLDACLEVADTIGVLRLDRWNDAPARTKHEVLDALQRTAIRTDTAHQRLYVPEEAEQ